MRLMRPDLEAIWDFLVGVDDLAIEEAYPREMLDLLRLVVPSDAVAYQELDLQSRSFRTPVDPDDDEALYWTVGPCPITEYRVRTGDLSAIRMSDVVGRHRYHDSPFYREYFLPVGFDHVLDLGLSTGGQVCRSVVLIRGSDTADFSDRDRAALELLRPHLRAREALVDLQRRARQADEATTSTDATDAHPTLTAREREVLRLAGEGWTNAEIASQLWLAPSTVKKHLEHVYEKLGVAGRAEAVTTVWSAFQG